MTAARIHYLISGISNPAEEHSPDEIGLMERFDRGRFFSIDRDKKIIFEEGTDWYAPLKPPHLKEGEAIPEVSLFGAGVRG